MKFVNCTGRRTRNNPLDFVAGMASYLNAGMFLYERLHRRL